MPTTTPRMSRARREALSITAWWALLALVLWILGHATGHPSGLAATAVSATLMAAIGETGAWARRRWKARRPPQERDDAFTGLRAETRAARGRLGR